MATKKAIKAAPVKAKAKAAKPTEAKAQFKQEVSKANKAAQSTFVKLAKAHDKPKPDHGKIHDLAQKFRDEVDNLFTSAESQTEHARHLAEV